MSLACGRFRVDEKTTLLALPVPRRHAIIVNNHEVSNETHGQSAASLVYEDQEAGCHEVVFERPDLSGGVYLCRLDVSDFVATRELVSFGKVLRFWNHTILMNSHPSVGLIVLDLQAADVHQSLFLSASKGETLSSRR